MSIDLHLFTPFIGERIVLNTWNSSIYYTKTAFPKGFCNSISLAFKCTSCLCVEISLLVYTLLLQLLDLNLLALNLLLDTCNNLLNLSNFHINPLPVALFFTVRLLEIVKQTMNVVIVVILACCDCLHIKNVTMLFMEHQQIILVWFRYFQWITVIRWCLISQLVILFSGCLALHLFY